MAQTAPTSHETRNQVAISSENSLATPFFLKAFNDSAVKKSGSSTTLISAELCQVHTI